MPWPFNNVATTNQYSAATTAQFPVGKPRFSLQVYNAAIIYQLIAFRPPNDFHPAGAEHFLAPSLASFSSALGEELAAGELFGGVMVKSAVVGTPARVTVI